MRREANRVAIVTHHKGFLSHESGEGEGMRKTCKVCVSRKYLFPGSPQFRKEGKTLSQRIKHRSGGESDEFKWWFFVYLRR